MHYSENIKKLAVFEREYHSLKCFIYYMIKQEEIGSMDFNERIEEIISR